MAGIRDEWQEGEGNYQTFLLRCWQENDWVSGNEPEGLDNWRFALVEVNDLSQTKCFASLENLLVHMRDRFGQAVSDTVDSLGGSLHRSE